MTNTGGLPRTKGRGTSSRKQPDPTEQQPAEAARSSYQERIAQLKESILASDLGTMPAPQLVATLNSLQGMTLEQAYLAACLRKEEVLPHVLGMLQTGALPERRMMTKFLRYVGWPEALPVLTGIIQNREEGSVIRIAALYAVAAIGDADAAPAVVSALKASVEGSVERRIAESTLGTLKYRKALPDIETLRAGNDPLAQIYHSYALAQLGGKADPQPLYDALSSDDYVIRQEACAVLGMLGGLDATAVLAAVVRNDAHSGVRQAARVALITLETAALPEPERARVLKESATDPDKGVWTWAISSLATDCGKDGREALRALATENTRVGEKSRFYLVVLETAGEHFGGRY